MNKKQETTKKKRLKEIKVKVIVTHAPEKEKYALTDI